MEPRNYIAIIGDIRKSKAISNRQDVQSKLANVLGNINEHYSEEIASNLTITIGDEFQGLLRSSRNLVEILLQITLKLRPVDFRFGIGLGEMTTPFKKEISIGSDGPCYYYAREAIEEVKRYERKKNAEHYDCILKMKEKPEQEELVNMAFISLFSIVHSWTENQKNTITRFHESDETSISAIADSKIQARNIAKTIKSARYYDMKAFKRAIENWFMGEMGL